MFTVDPTTLMFISQRYKTSISVTICTMVIKISVGRTSGHFIKADREIHTCKCFTLTSSIKGHLSSGELLPPEPTLLSLALSMTNQH